MHKGDSGSVVDVDLVDGSKLVTVIGGGYADLYYWEEGQLNQNTITK